MFSKDERNEVTYSLDTYMCLYVVDISKFLL